MTTTRFNRIAKPFLIGVSIGAFACMMFAVVGCSTVSGLAKDLGAASDGMRQAMTQDE